MKAAIVGVAGLALSPAELDLLRASRPAGVILFARNIDAPDQLRRLGEALRAVLAPEAVLMIDQEGGRVARLRPPHWRAHPAPAAYGRAFRADAAAGLRAAWLGGAVIGAECAAAGFDVVAAPVLDLQVAGASEVIGDRSFGAAGEAVGALGRAFAAGLLAAGVQPVGKHVPGHGRARVDSHLGLPVVDAICDEELIPFASNADLPWMMTAHVCYTAWDRERPATLSSAVIGGIIRGRIGFGGVLVSDDLAMGAVSERSGPGALAASAVAAGCDVALHCSGVLAETAAVLELCPELAPHAAARMAAGRARAERARRPLDIVALAAERDRLVG